MTRIEQCQHRLDHSYFPWAKAYWQRELQRERNKSAKVRKLPPNVAGFIQAPIAASMFYESNERVIGWLKAREYAEEQRACRE